MQRPQLFISYSSTDVDFGLRLATDLLNAGVHVWMDRLQIAPWEHWKQKLREAVTQSTVLLPIFTTNFIISRYTQREFAAFVRRDCPMIPLLLQGSARSDVEAFIDQRLIDFSAWHHLKVYQDQFHALLDVIKTQFPELLGAPPDPVMQSINKFIMHTEMGRSVISYLETRCLTEVWRYEDFRPQPILSRLSQTHRYPHAGVDVDAGVTAKTSAGRIDDVTLLAQHHTRFFVTGAAGSGKTFILQNLALGTAFQFKASQGVSPLPLMVQLDAADTDWASAVRSAWQLEGDPLDMLARGKLALFLDDIDVNSDPKQTHRLFDALRDWLRSERAPQRLVMSCQPNYGDKIAPFDLPIVVIDALDMENCQRICNAYLSEDEAYEFATSLSIPLNSSSKTPMMVFELARYPMLLHALLIYHVTSGYETIDCAADLIEWMLRTLWDHLSEASALRVSFEEIQQRLAGLAHKMIQQDVSVSVSKSEALHWLGDALILEALKSARLLQSRQDRVRFTDDMFKHYFAMLALREIDIPRLVSKPRLNHDHRRIPGKWDQALKLLVGRMPRPDKLVLDIAAIDPLLALDCANVSVHISDETGQTLLNLLQSPIEPDMYIAAAHILEGSDDKNAIRFLNAGMRARKWSTRQAAATALQALPDPAIPEFDHVVRSNAYETAELIWYLAHYLRHGEQRHKAAEALGQLGDRAAVPLLVGVLNDPDDTVSIQAAGALGLLNDAEAVPYLMQRLDAPHLRVGRASMQALVALQDVSLEPMLRLLNSKSASTLQKSAAIEALSLMRAQKALDVVLRAARSENLDERAAAVKALRNVGNSAAVRRLSANLDDERKPVGGDRSISRLAQDSLEAINSHEAQAALDRWRSKQPEATGSTRKRWFGRQPSTPAANSATHVQHPDWMMRREAVVRLAAASANTAVPQLIRALGDEDSQVRLAAVQGLLQFADDGRVVPALLPILQDDDHLVHDAARDILLRVAARPLPALLDLIDSPNLNTRASAIQIAGVIGETHALPALIEALSDLRRPWLAEQRICDVAAAALKAMNTPDAQAALEHWRSMQPEDDRSVKAASEAPEMPIVPEIKTDIEILLEQIRHNSWEDRHESAKSLRDLVKQGGIGDERLARLLSGLTDADWHVRWSVAEALGWLKIAEAVQPLAQLLDDPNWTVRVAAIRAFAEINDPQTAEWVAGRLADEHSLVREAAAESLGKIGGQTAEAALLEALDDTESFVVIAALKALGELKSHMALERLKRLLGEPAVALRWYAAQALSTIADPSTVPELIMLLTDTDYPHWEDQRICDLAAEALLIINTPQALEALKTWNQHALTHLNNGEI